MDVNDSMKIITENYHAKKNKLSNTLIKDNTIDKNEIFDLK